MRDTILYDSALRLFGDHVSPQILEAAEAGEWPAALWRAVDEAGYLDVLVDGTGGMVEAVAILRAAGHHAAPIPLPETMLARWLCAASGIEAPAGPLSMTLTEPDDSGAIRAGAVGPRGGGVAIVSGSTLAAPRSAAFAPGPALPASACWSDRGCHCPPAIAERRGRRVAAAERGLRRSGARRRGAAAGGADGGGDGSRARPRDDIRERPGAVRPPDRQVPGDPAAARPARRRGGGVAGCRRKRRCQPGRGAGIGRLRARRRENPSRRGGRRRRRDRASGARRDRLHRGTLLALPDPAAVVVARRVRRRGLLGRSARPAHRGGRAAPGCGR